MRGGARLQPDVAGKAPGLVGGGPVAAHLVGHRCPSPSDKARCGRAAVRLRFSREIIYVILHPYGVGQPCYPGNVD
jgi:hypothetical protein